jgi:isopenicillin-N epimerase
MRQHWSLDPGVTFLNHGSFGATPRAVQAAQTRWRERIESEPVRFFVEELAPALDHVRARLGAFVNTDPAELALIPNATHGVATVLANLAEPDYCRAAGIAIEPGDELLFASHEYQACINQLRQLARRTGATSRMVRLEFPIASPEAALSTIHNAITPRTKLALLSHVTSPTALILPIRQLVPDLERRGIACIVDGAHAPGFVDERSGGLDLAVLGASFYTANCHKWICSPKGSAFLHVRRDRQAGFRPLALSNNAESPKPGRSQFLTEFDYLGTTDPTAVLCIPDAIDTLASLAAGGWPSVIATNRRLALDARNVLCRELGLTPPAPEAMLGSMATLELPPPRSAEHAHRLAARPTRYADALQDALLDRHRLQLPVWAIPAELTPGRPTRRLFRISAQLYNTIDEYERLAHAMREELARENALG